MEKKRSFKRTAIIVASFIAVLGVSVFGTYAFLTSRTNEVRNTFVVGSVETEITEEHFNFETATVIDKDPQVKNVGKNDCYIRARINITPAGENITVNELGANWVDGGDGYYYYTEKVAPDELTSPIFTKVTIPAGWVNYSNGQAVATENFKDFDVIVYQEAIVADLEGVSVYQDAWAAYNGTTTTN